MNYMDQVAKMLGVELGEEFEIEGKGAVYKFLEERGLQNINGENCSDTLHGLLYGALQIKKKPWEPKPGEVYWYPTPAQDHLACWCTCNANNNVEETRKNRGLRFRTQEEAVEVAEKMLKALEATK